MNRLLSGRSTVYEQDVRYKLTEEHVLASKLDINGLGTNAGTIYLGGPTVYSVVDSENGLPLAADNFYTVSNVYLDEVWFCGTDADDALIWTAVIEIA